MSRKSANALTWAIEHEWSVIPVGPNKKSLVPWKPFQDRRPTKEEIGRWTKLKPSAWAVVTGAISRIVTLDFDGEQGKRTLERLKLRAHRATPSGGFHVDFQHPGWKVPTLNSKTKKELGRRWPSLDIRADGGYAIIFGRSKHGEYGWLIDDDPFDLKILPADLRLFLHLDHADAPQQQTQPPGSNQGTGAKPEPMTLVNRALDEARHGRNDAGAWLAMQLRDNDYNEAYAGNFMRIFARRVPARNSKGQVQPYTETEALATLRSIYSRPARGPWAPPRKKIEPISSRRPSNHSTAATPEGQPSVRRSRWSFRIEQSGVFLVDLDHRDQDRWISPPLEIVARVRDFNGEGSGKLLRFRNEDNQVKECIVPNSALIGEGKEALERLLDMGFKPSRAKNDLERLKDYIYQGTPDCAVRCVSSIGWHSHFFVLPNRSFGPIEASEDVRFSSEIAIDHKYHSAGSLEDWKRNVSRLCAGNSRLVFAVSCAFAAPLLELVKADNGGFHFRGLSSIGKTTALLAAGSVWGGNAQTGFLQTWRATANGIEARAAMHNHALLCLDEISEVSEREVGEIVYTLGNGAGKGRMTRHITSRSTTQFKVLFLSSGERTLREIMQAAGKQTKGGQESRLIDIPADAGMGKGIFEELHEHATADTIARELSQSAKTFYGTAIQEFLAQVAAHTNDVGQDARRDREEFLLKHVPRDAAGEVFRAGSLFGLIAAAGELATLFGVTGWEKGESRGAVEACFSDWVKGRGGMGAHDIEAGIDAVRSFLEMHGSSRFEDVNEIGKKSVYERAGFREKVNTAEGGQFAYYVYPNVFQNEACKGFDYRLIGKELLKRGHLKRHSGETHLSIVKRIRGEGPVRCYAILPTIFGEPEEPEAGDLQNSVVTVETVVTDSAVA